MKYLILLILSAGFAFSQTQNQTQKMENLSPEQKALMRGYLGLGTVATENRTIDLFCIAGQSNSFGRGGNISLAPAPVEGVMQWTSTGGVAPLALVAGTSFGEGLGTSIAPAFGNTYSALSGRKVAFVMGAGVDSASQTVEADVLPRGNFDTTGTLRVDVVTRYLAAKAAFEAAKYKVRLAGIIWMQGEADAEVLFNNNTSLTREIYRARTQTMIAYYRTNLGADLPFYMVRTGMRTNITDATGPQIIRDEQDKISAEDPKTRQVFKYADKFPALGLLSDTVHYTQGALNLIGAESAKSILGIENASATTIINAGELVEGLSALSVRAKMPTTLTATYGGAVFDFEGAGSSSFGNQALRVIYRAGYTGSSPSIAVNALNQNASSAGVLIPPAGSSSPTANTGVSGTASGVGPGVNLGVQGLSQGAKISVGVGGYAQTPKDNATNIGVLGTALNTGAPTAVQVGGHFTLNGGQPSLSSGLSASNGTTTSRIFTLYDNLDAVFTVQDGGTVFSTAGFTFVPPASTTPATNGQLTFEATNNTTLTVKMKGSDGVVRSAVLTLTP